MSQNVDEDLQGVFVHGETDGQVWAAGSINWARAGHHFKLETCTPEGDEKTCYIWKEMDPHHWLVFVTFFKVSVNKLKIGS